MTGLKDADSGAGKERGSEYCEKADKMKHQDTCNG
jgi:hypothetical protein